MVEKINKCISCIKLSKFSVIGINKSEKSELVLKDILRNFNALDIGEVKLDYFPNILSIIRDKKIDKIINDSINDNTYTPDIVLTYLKGSKNDNINDPESYPKLKEIAEELRSQSVRYRMPVVVLVDTYLSADGIEFVGDYSFSQVSDFQIVINDGNVFITKNRFR
jgi:hypothetical protein